MPAYVCDLDDEAETQAAAAEVAALLHAGLVLFFEGELGSGKTTFARGILRGLGYSGAVKSPTYTVVESYEFEAFQVFHFDLFRLSDPEELELLGFRDYFREDSLCLIEWPSKGGNMLPQADLELSLSTVSSAANSTISTGRRLRCCARSPAGATVLEAWQRAGRQ